MRTTKDRRGNPDRSLTRQGQVLREHDSNPRRGRPDRTRKVADVAVVQTADVSLPVLTEVFTASRVKPIKHGLAREPGVFLYDSDGDQIEAHVQHITEDILVLNFVGTLTNATVDLY